LTPSLTSPHRRVIARFVKRKEEWDAFVGGVKDGEFDLMNP
jgi:hypothetical protein